MIWYSCVGSGTPKYTTTMQALNDRDGSLQPPDLQTSKSLTPHLGVTKGQPAHFSDLAPCNPHQSNAPNGSSCWIFFIPMTHLLLKKHPSDLEDQPWRFDRLQSSNKFVRQSSGQSFHSPASGKGPALVIGLPAHHLRLQNNQQDRFCSGIRESVAA